MNTFETFSAMLLFSYPIYESAAAVERVVRRVPGGYMNHWSIRQVTYEPCAMVIESRHMIVAHPTIAREIRNMASRAMT